MERTEIDAVRRMPLADFLARLGHEPVRRSGNELWYIAPYRSERTPSFRVNVAKQLWYDFGTGTGGDIFTLAGEFIGSNDFMKQVKFIAETVNMPMPVPEVSKPTFQSKPSEPAFEEMEAAPLFRSPLTDYLAERGILYAVASRYCCRLNYGVRGKRYFAIGFPNVAGGFEVRNRFFKGCVAPKDISHIRQQGEAREKCLVFEGMMDYLSFLTLRKRNCSNLPDLDRQDYVILNSTANVSKAIDVLHGYGRIHCMLDNDEAGRKAYRELERKFAGRIRDFSDNYKGHKDLNDYLRGIRQKLAVSPPPRTIVKPKKKGLGL